MAQFSFSPMVVDGKPVPVSVAVNSMAPNGCGLTTALHVHVGSDSVQLCSDDATFRAVARALAEQCGAWLEANPEAPALGTFEVFDQVLLDGEVKGEVLRVLPGNRAIVLVGDNPLTVPFHRLHKDA